MSTYTIKYGDTLSGIAQRNNTTVSNLMSLNPYITNANKIYAGKTLTLPDAQPVAQPVSQPVVQAPVQTQPTQSTQELADAYARQQTANVNSEGQELLAQYQKIAEAQKQALQKQQEVTTNQINDQRDNVMETYNTNARQAYINSMLGKKTVQQQLSQAGLNTSGLLGSAYANVENAYGNNLASLQNTRDTSIQNINKQLRDAQLQYSAQEQQLLADIGQAEMELTKYNNELAYKKYQDAINNYMAFNNFDYTKSRDAVSDSQWQQQFDYQKQRDAVSDDQWLKEYQLALKKASASSSKKSSGGTSGTIKQDDNTKAQYSAQDIISNATLLQMPGNQGAVKDGISGKTFSSMKDLLKYYDV